MHEHKRIKILVVGKNGQLAQTLDAMSRKGIEILCQGRPEVDLTEPSTLDTALGSFSPDVVINAAAYTAVDKAEEEEERAYAINAEGVKALAERCQQRGVKLVHVSTDYVFSGDASELYKETDATAPLGVYGKTKLAGEELAMEACPNTTVVRVSWLYSDYGNNFVKTMLRLAETRDELGIVSDQFGRPTYAKNLADFLVESLMRDKLGAGVYHFSNTGEVASWYDFAVAIFERARAYGLKVPSTVNAIATSDYPTPAARPKWSVFDLTKVQQSTGFFIPEWKRALDLYFNANYKK